MKTNLIKLIGAAIIVGCAVLAIAQEATAQTTTTAQKEVKTCKGVKADKTNCKSTFIVKGTDYCNAHNPNAIHCSGTTAKNQPCKMSVKAQGEKCRFHVAQ